MFVFTLVQFHCTVVVHSTWVVLPARVWVDSLLENVGCGTGQAIRSEQGNVLPEAGSFE